MRSFNRRQTELHGGCKLPPVGHLLRLSPLQRQPAGHISRRHGEWFVLLYAITVSVIANWAIPYWPPTKPLFLIAIGLPVIFRARNYIWAIIGVAMVLTGVVWLIVLAPRT